jgi:hypothetical protein
MYSQQQRPSKSEMEAKLSQNFTSSDSSGNGTLNLDELTEILSNAPTPPNGKVSGSDTSSKASELMKAADSNEDGELSQDEMKAGMEQMHQQMMSKGEGIKQKINEQSNGGGFEKDMQSLASAIESGDLEGAKTLLEEISSHKPPEGANSDMESKRDEDFKALSDALESGDSSSISTALKTIQTNMSQSGNSSNSSSSGNNQGFDLKSILSKLASNYATQTSADLSSFLAISA